uniref:Uncharacterized protein n=1 Tax=Arundo donax TaxID=35708 RepID=A0A0A8YXN0_ARUDO
MYPTSVLNFKKIMCGQQGIDVLKLSKEFLSKVG